MKSAVVSPTAIGVPLTEYSPINVGRNKQSHHRYTFVETTPDDFLNETKKPVGRPKNLWTPSRCRKLARLYILTTLNVDEVVQALYTKTFAPW